MEENKDYLSKQLIAYLGNKKKLLAFILGEVEEILEELGQEKAVICDLFSGSGSVSRALKKYASLLYANDLEEYSSVINTCYLTNQEDFPEEEFQKWKSSIEERLSNGNFSPSFVTEEYAPKDTNNIQDGERCFYTHENALIIDTIRAEIEKMDDSLKPFFLGPLMYEATRHANTSGVFKGFYREKAKRDENGGIIRAKGKFGGEGENSLERILSPVQINRPILSNFSCESVVLKEDAVELSGELKNIDITYLDPPYNQHPYGSNYFMLNAIIDGHIDSEHISEASGIPQDWNKSAFNAKATALAEFEKIIASLDSKYLIISYNNEGLIPLAEMADMLRKYGRLKIKQQVYNTFRGSKNLSERNKYTREYLFILKKGENPSSMQEVMDNIVSMEVGLVTDMSKFIMKNDFINIIKDTLSSTKETIFGTQEFGILKCFSKELIDKITKAYN